MIRRTREKAFAEAGALPEQAAQVPLAVPGVRRQVRRRVGRNARQVPQHGQNGGRPGVKGGQTEVHHPDELVQVRLTPEVGADQRQEGRAASSKRQTLSASSCWGWG